ncbi:MAG: SDR family oxidoreductase, partial [Cyanobacteria bacterium P01_A01_bin.135]
GRSTSPEVAPYCASKWGIEGLTRSLAQELPSGLAAVALNPGIIHTDILEQCFGAASSSYDTVADWRLRAVPYLLSLGPRHNGQALSVP